MSFTQTPAQFLALYPEFNAISTNSVTLTAIVQTALDAADAIVSDTQWSTTRRTYIVDLVAAHRLTVRYAPTVDSLNGYLHPGLQANQNISPTGLVLNVAHNSMVTGDQAFRADYSRTEYGLEFLGIVDTLAPASSTAAAEATTYYY